MSMSLFAAVRVTRYMHILGCILLFVTLTSFSLQKADARAEYLLY